MSPRYGIRKIEDIEGGVIAWLYPGGADLDEVLLEIARWDEYAQEEWWETTLHTTAGPYPRVPDSEYTDETAAEWRDYWSHIPPMVSTLDEEFPTRLAHVAGEILDVGYYRKMPWCHCGEGHGWHFEPSGPGPGAMLAVVVGGVA